MWGFYSQVCSHRRLLMNKGNLRWRSLVFSQQCYLYPHSFSALCLYSCCANQATIWSLQLNRSRPLCQTLTISAVISVPNCCKPPPSHPWPRSSSSESIQSGSPFCFSSLISSLQLTYQAQPCPLPLKYDGNGKHTFLLMGTLLSKVMTVYSLM